MTECDRCVFTILHPFPMKIFAILPTSDSSPGRPRNGQETQGRHECLEAWHGRGCNKPAGVGVTFLLWRAPQPVRRFGERLVAPTAIPSRFDGNVRAKHVTIIFYRAMETM